MKKHESGSPCYLEGAAFYVRRFGTAETQKQVDEIKESLYGFAPKDIDHGLIIAHWLVEYGVTGWDGVLDGDDDIAYSQQAARSVFLNPAYFQSLNQLLIAHASEYANYLHDKAVEDVDEVKKA